MRLHFTLKGQAFYGTTERVNLLTRSGDIFETPLIHAGNKNCYSFPTQIGEDGMPFRSSICVEFDGRLTAEAKLRLDGAEVEQETETKSSKKKEPKKAKLTKQERKDLLEIARGERTFSDVENEFISLLVEIMKINSSDFKLPEDYKTKTELKKEKIDLFLQEHLIGIQNDSVQDWLDKEIQAYKYKDNIQRVVGN